MASKELRWGIMGCARISRRGLIPGIQGSKSGELYALASRDIDQARAWAVEFGIPRIHQGYQALLDDPDVDAVYIPLPNELHKPWVFAAADAGKHILCEKPLALDAAEAREMIEHCRAKKVVLMEAFMWRHQPRVAELRRLIADGVIGQLRLIRSSFSFPIDLTDWRLDPTRGGGALWDVGCYGVSTVRLFAGEEPATTQAIAHFSDRGVDLSLAAQYRVPSGVLGSIDCSFEQPFRCSYELVGSEGKLDVPDAYLPPERPVAYLTDSHGMQELTFDGRNQYAAMVDNFTEAVRNGRTLISPAEDGLAQMIALETTLSAAR